jgi:LacI family transcriptional regulator
MAKRGTTSMRDVARLAGVSVGTISNVLNHPEAVSEATRERVQEAIDKLGWVPNESARQLRAGRSRSIGLVVMDVANPFFADLARGVEDVAEGAGYSVLLANSAQLKDRQDRHIKLLGQQRVRGVVLAPIGEDLDVSPLSTFGIPVVLADRSGLVGTHCTVSVDDFLGGQLAATHLLDQGHTRIAIAGGSADIRQVRDRRDGGLRAALLTRPDAVVMNISTPTLDISAGRRVAEAVAAMPLTERPTAVFATNDLVAIGLLQGLVTRSIRVPEDIAIIGYDDIEYAAAAAVPLSSIRQPRAELGRRAAELLMQEITAIDEETPHEHQHVVFSPQLVVRASSTQDATAGDREVLGSRASG